MSFQAMAWADIGDVIDCRVCGKEITAEFAYQRMGVCGSCVRSLGHEYSIAHSGAPTAGFSSPEQMEEYLNSQPAVYRKARISSRLRTLVFERDKYRCKQCGSYANLQADHIFPESKGGETTLTNLQTLCGDCNIRKGASVP